MTKTIQKWGNSQGVRLPKETLAAAGLAVGQEVSVDVSADRIILRPAKPKRKRIRIEDLLAKMPKHVKSLGEEWKDRPQGKEVW
jgi:antitoxin MazE